MAVDHGNNDFFDPLRASNDNGALSEDVSQDSGSNSTVELSNEVSTQSQEKEWSTFKRFLMQRFPVSKIVSVSSVIISSFRITMLIRDFTFRFFPLNLAFLWSNCVFVASSIGFVIP